MFKPSILVTNNDTIIALRYIESIVAARDIDDQIVDKLRDDIVFDINTISGKTYEISTKKQMDLFKKVGTPSTAHETHEAIMEKWIWVINSTGNSL